MKHIFLTILSFVFLVYISVSVDKAHAQLNLNYSIIDNLNPVTPTQYQFSKYTDLPVSEYTGIPNISVPIYTIKEDGVKIPLELTYHSSGHKVDEEASWVGLGWDMTVGSIVQTIADQDDYNVLTHVQPDFYNTEMQYLFPPKYGWYIHPSGSADQICQQYCNTLISPVSTPNLNEGLVIYTGYYAPYNGDYGWHVPQNYGNFFFNHAPVNQGGYSVDSEPDIFTANFCGHSFKFMRDIKTGNIVLLNAAGYQVTRTGSNWTIIVPSGEEYDFTEEDVVNSYSVSDALTSQTFDSLLAPSSNIWMLTKIITKNKKVITLNYQQTSSQSCYPSFSQRGAQVTLTNTYCSSNENDWQNFAASSDNSGFTPNGGLLRTISYSFDHYTYLSSITFPNGTVNFSLSARNDVKGGLKLDSVAIFTDQVVKSCKFNYTYMNATNVGGHVFNFPDTSHLSTYSLYRLQLSSMVDNSGATYNFTYNSTQLPAKNSFAIDYWGYYNGDTTNTTFIPNPAQFNKTGFYASTDNHSANLPYTQAGILTRIQYPTGGSANFTYELNQFTNYFVPDYSTNTNTVSSGDGLRVKTIIWKDAGGNQLQQTNYAYNGGIASLPLNFFRSYGYLTTPPGNLQIGSGQCYVLQQTFNVNETNMSGSFTANPFASFNGVGYQQVIKTDVDNNGNPNGKTVSNYFNEPDQVYNAVYAANQVNPTLPAFKNAADTADNGSLKSELIYDSSNNLLKKVVNSYENVSSSIYYGARMMSFATLNRYIYYNQTSPPYYAGSQVAQNMVCYYPIYDFISLLTGTAETDYFGSNAVTTTTTNTYDSYNQLSGTTKTNSTYTQGKSYTYPYNYPSNTVLTAMTTANRLSDIITATEGTSLTSSYFARSYKQIGGLFVAAEDSSWTGIIESSPLNITKYDQFDTSNGNILQYSKNTMPNSILWDYNREYVIAEVKNALYTNVAYTSFEADGTGRWKFTGTTTPDPNAPTGQKVYSLSNGNIYRDSLNTTLTYVVSYWSKNGAQTVSGSGTTKQGYTINGYTYYETTVTNPASGTITVSGTGTIDELRLYPNTAQMKSFTYAPLVGVTSESNEGGKIAYYEYDNALRLLDIRDQNKNILKAFCYNYAGQPTTCGLDITYSSQAQSQSFSRNNCSSGYVGSSVTYTVPLAKYTSTMSLDDANRQAIEDINANGQSYANANGTCVIPPSITALQYAGHGGVGYTQVIFTTIPSCSTTVIYYTDLTTNTPYSDAGGCTSPRYETLIVGHNYQFTITCYSAAFPSGITSAPYNYTPLD